MLGSIAFHRVPTMKLALLAEDDPVSRAFLVEALLLLGWRCHAFETGEAAAAAAIEQRFELLLLDLNLPGHDGIDVLRRIRNLDTHASVDAPALALTADHDPAQHRRLRRSGFDAVATKPISLHCLAAALAYLGLASEEIAADCQTPDSDASPAPAPDTLPIWQDGPALAAVGGDAATLAALRELMLRDLPQQCERILADPTSESARRELHRLRAACGFCGATHLARAVAALEQARCDVPDAALVEAFADSAARTLATTPD